MSPDAAALVAVCVCIGGLLVLIAFALWFVSRHGDNP